MGFYNKIAGFVGCLLFSFLVGWTSIAFANTDKSTVDQHPLLTGSLKGEKAEQRLFEFIREMNKSKKHRKSDYWIYNEFVDDIGTIRIKKYLQAVDPACHGVSHALGKVIGEREPELYKGMQICGDTCTYGCIHGVFKVYFNKLGKEYHSQKHQHSSNTSNKMQMSKHEKKAGLSKKELADFAKDVNKACAKPISVVKDFFRGNCAHGVGHAMGMLAPNVKAATQYCKVFSEKTMQYYCETGVFMEMAGMIKKQLFPSKTSRKAQLAKSIDFCSGVSETPSACLRFLVWPNNLFSHVENFARLCDEKTGSARRGCFNALGFSSRHYLSASPALINQVCAEFPDKEDKKACVSGVAYMKKGNKFRDAIKTSCTYLSDEGLKQACLGEVNQYYYKLDNKLFEALL